MGHFFLLYTKYGSTRIWWGFVSFCVSTAQYRSPPIARGEGGGGVIGVYFEWCITKQFVSNVHVLQKA